MKIVQTLWTAPAYRSQDFTHNKKGLAMGWRHAFYNAASWTLSCLLWREWYGNIHLYTDKAGRDFLIDTLRLPYDTVSVIPDALPYPPELWIMGKVHVYGLQQEPFLNTDGDTFAFRPLPVKITEAPLIAQHRERVTFYHTLYQKLKDRLRYEPRPFATITGKLKEGPAFNNGLIGGQHAAFFRQYAGEVSRFVSENAHLLNKSELGDFNVLCEQVLYYAMAEEADIPVACLLDVGELPSPHNLWKVRQRISKDGYLHPVSAYKRHPLICTFVSEKLRSLYPYYYYRLKALASGGRLYG